MLCMASVLRMRSSVVLYNVIPHPMTPDQLIAEGRNLQRPCVFLRPRGTGPVAAVWHARDKKAIESTGFRRWITVDCRHVPAFSQPNARFLELSTDEETLQGGRILAVSSLPTHEGTPLYAHAASVLPPIEAVFARGSNAVDEWLKSIGWNRNWPYTPKGDDTVDAYVDVWMNEFPLYLKPDIYAILGGWHFPWPDDDWRDLIDEHLLILTLHDSEPWVEAWQTRAGPTRVIQRIT